VPGQNGRITDPRRDFLVRAMRHFVSRCVFLPTLSRLEAAQRAETFHIVEPAEIKPEPGKASRRTVGEESRDHDVDVASPS